METLRPPSAAILKAAGINCENETVYAFEKAGANAELFT
jgi:phosphoribosylformylglycinamidine (FGAM) synthase-like amidotransferase family enzyme